MDADRKKTVTSIRISQIYLSAIDLKCLFQKLYLCVCLVIDACSDTSGCTIVTASKQQDCTPTTKPSFRIPRRIGLPICLNTRRAGSPSAHKRPGRLGIHRGCRCEILRSCHSRAVSRSHSATQSSRHIFCRGRSSKGLISS